MLRATFFFLFIFCLSSCVAQFNPHFNHQQESSQRDRVSSDLTTPRFFADTSHYNANYNTQKQNENRLFTQTSASGSDDVLVQKLKRISEQPLSGEETAEVMKEVTGNFLLGPGLGETAIDIAGIAAFPPYAIALLGNSLLSLAGYEQISIKKVMDNETREGYGETADVIYSAPAKLLSFITGNDYRDRGEIKKRWVEVVDRLDSQRAEHPHPQNSVTNENWLNST